MQQPGSGDGSPAQHPEQKVGEPWSVRWWDLARAEEEEGDGKNSRNKQPFLAHSERPRGLDAPEW